VLCRKCYLYTTFQLKSLIVLPSPYPYILILSILLIFFFFLYGATTLKRVLASLPFRAVLYFFCPLHNLHLLQIIPDITIPSRLGPSSWSSCEWFPFVYSFHYAGFGHSIYVSKQLNRLAFNIIYYVPVFN